MSPLNLETVHLTDLISKPSSQSFAPVATMNPPKLIFGAFQFDRQDEEDRKRTLDICQENGIKELDCGAIYVCMPLQ